MQVYTCIYMRARYDMLACGQIFDRTPAPTCPPVVLLVRSLSLLCWLFGGFFGRSLELIRVLFRAFSWFLFFLYLMYAHNSGRS